ncbi:MAG: NAD(P)H-binding protein [Saprospiraceae bacterium]|nr:NAD(P)H-binding protein [Saprospiraceae bacterium]
MNDRIALVFGGSGMTGTSLVHKLLGTTEYTKIRLFVRKKLTLVHPKLEQFITDFDNLALISNQISGDTLFLCLGTTMARAKSKASFYKVDYTYTINVANIALKNEVNKVILISSMGADPGSLIYYSKVKGQVEKTIKSMPFKIVAIIRPSLLLGNRNEKRVGEKLGALLSGWFSGLFVGPFRKYQAISSDAVADAMIKIANSQESGIQIYESDTLKNISEINN